MESTRHHWLISAMLLKPRPGMEPCSWQWVGAVCLGFIWSQRCNLRVVLKGLTSVGGHTQLLCTIAFGASKLGLRNPGLLNYMARAEDEIALNLQPASAKFLAFNSIKIKEPNFCLLLHEHSSYRRQWKLCTHNWGQILAWATNEWEPTLQAHLNQDPVPPGLLITQPPHL